MNTSEHSVISRVNTLIGRAISNRASDIHLESAETNLRVRFRIDGILFDQDPIELAVMQQVVSRVKVLANINIAEKRIPQDGKFSTVFEGHTIDFRVSTFPSLHGEKVVIRILDRTAQAIALDQLGFLPSMQESFKQLICRPHGFFLVTGPTGSGKTTTLYAALSTLNNPEKNVATLEDPVEYQVNGITQGHINTEAGFTFEKGIRALLRQDPDILLIGEVRDRQTARVAIEAALTGHLVLSTLHTNDAPSAIMRLMDMEIEPFLINAALTGVLAQRLARRLCQQCKEEKNPNDQQRAMLSKHEIDAHSLYSARGCAHCDNRGYKGRIGIFELLPISNNLRSLIVKHPQIDTLYSQASKEGMKTLLQDGFSKVKDGQISFDELIRVII